MKNFFNEDAFAKIYENYFKSEQSNLMLNLLLYQKWCRNYSFEQKKEWFNVYEFKMKEWFDIDGEELEINLNGLKNLHYIQFNKRKTKEGKVYYGIRINWEVVLDYFSNIINNSFTKK